MNAPIPPRKPSSFAGLVRRPGGLSMDEAVRAADANLLSMRGRLVAEIGATLERMQALGGELRDGSDRRALDELYDLSNSVIGMAGASGLPTLGQVCFSLCELIDRSQTSQAWHRQAVKLHFDSLKALRPGAADAGVDGEVVAAALRRVVARI